MPICYRAVHARSPWRKVQIHQTLENAIDGRDGAKALLLRKGRVGKKWEQYGRPLCVFVWDSAKPSGYLLRLSPDNAAEVQMVELSIDTILRHEARESCSAMEVKEYFKATARTSSQIEPSPIDSAKSPLGVETPERIETNRPTFLRDMTVRSWIQQNAAGVCEGCGKLAPFVAEDGTPFLEVHHIRSLADGGSDKITNTVALCPNCHRRAHLSRDRDEFKALLYKSVGRLVLE
ncbi:MAG: HNH endonuclease signature motif containing protein [Chromatiales bacterium]|jgi:hypothetical protein|nr:HNH endonuclease signature motif containing protein [Chromatiales bacterium]